MPAAYEAVILAAGRGSRLSAHTSDSPKALLSIGPRSQTSDQPTSFLRRQVELLYQAGVEKVVVVVGYLRDQVMREMEGWSKVPELVVNDTSEISTSGSLHSFQFAVRAGLGILDGTRQTLMMDADIVYHHRVLDPLLSAPEQSTILVSEQVTADQEEVLVYGTKEAPRYLGKGLTPAMVGGAPLLGEATGIVKLAPADHQLCRAITDWMLGDPDAAAGSLALRGFGPARRATEHEELTQRLMHLGKMKAVTFDKSLPFMEVDCDAEYDALKARVYPQILQMEADEVQKKGVVS
jgi:choline kinase